MDVYPVTKRATVTNVTENHLNWHKDYGEYISAKKNLYKNTREPVFGCDCPVVKEMLPSVYVSISEEAKEGISVRQSSPLFKVYASLVMATAEQLVLVEKVGSRLKGWIVL